MWGDSQAPCGFGWYSTGSWAKLKVMCRHERQIQGDPLYTWAHYPSPGRYGVSEGRKHLQTGRDSDRMITYDAISSKQPSVLNSRTHLVETANMYLSLLKPDQLLRPPDPPGSKQSNLNVCCIKWSSWEMASKTLICTQVIY